MGCTDHTQSLRLFCTVFYESRDRDFQVTLRSRTQILSRNPNVGFFFIIIILKFRFESINCNPLTLDPVLRFNWYVKRVADAFQERPGTQSRMIFDGITIRFLRDFENIENPHGSF